MSNNLIREVKAAGRQITQASAEVESTLGPLSQLVGTWKNEPELPGRGWNMIAVPFGGDNLGYRLLLNQYNETLTFDLVDKGVPNRGIATSNDDREDDQFLTALAYDQRIEQIATDDFPRSDLLNPNGSIIHHEPGLWLNMLNKTTNHVDIARLSTIPHGDSVLALGRSGQLPEMPRVPDISGLPIGTGDTLEDAYFAPYQRFHSDPFEGVFDPVHPNALLNEANQGVEIEKVTVLPVDTTVETGGIANIPFVTKQANATQLNATFWIQELKEKDANGNPKLRLQYSQTVFLEFFKRTDGVPGLIRWPHVSINTLVKVTD
ncbi:heme-binding protein [Thaumasiovibrio subtropicus]|uniref:heme-binding protein n=1 Tax=Thaumasiovibrio subtropicus TaxID=1891207 RepID=UPI000B35481D|nr:heme-binding protein [Thaumasiovibrio subtropicus]